MYSPDETFSRSLPALSLNCVMRLSQPNRATQVKIQASRTCAGTADCRNRMCCAGSIPQAISEAAISRDDAASVVGSWNCVSACKSTTQ